MIYEMHNLYQQENHMQNRNLAALQEAPNQEVNRPGQLLPITHARPTLWQRACLTLQSVAAVLVVAALIIGSVLLFTSRSHSPGAASHAKSVVTAQGTIIVLLGDGSIHAYHGGAVERVWSYANRLNGSALTALLFHTAVVYAGLGKD